MKFLFDEQFEPYADIDSQIQRRQQGEELIPVEDLKPGQVRESRLQQGSLHLWGDRPAYSDPGASGDFPEDRDPVITSHIRRWPAPGYALAPLLRREGITTDYSDPVHAPSAAWPPAKSCNDLSDPEVEQYLEYPTEEMPDYTTPKTRKDTGLEDGPGSQPIRYKARAPIITKETFRQHAELFGRDGRQLEPYKKIFEKANTRRQKNPQWPWRQDDRHFDIYGAGILPGQNWPHGPSLDPNLRLADVDDSTIFDGYKPSHHYSHFQLDDGASKSPPPLEDLNLSDDSDGSVKFAESLRSENFGEGYESSSDSDASQFMITEPWLVRIGESEMAYLHDKEEDQGPDPEDHVIQHIRGVRRDLNSQKLQAMPNPPRDRGRQDVIGSERGGGSTESSRSPVRRRARSADPGYA